MRIDKNETMAFFEKAKKQKEQYFKKRIESIDYWIDWLDGMWFNVDYPIDSAFLRIKALLKEIKKDFEEQ